MTLDKILAEETHKTPGKILAGYDRNATARPLPGPRQGPCQGHPRGHSQAHVYQGPAAPWPFRRSQPAYQLGAHLDGSIKLLGQPGKHLRGGMQIFMKTLPPHQRSSQPASMALHDLIAWTRVEARRGGDRRDELPCHPR